MAERINIGCKLPHGFLIEVGLHAKTQQPTDDYAAIVLQGTLKARKGSKHGSTLVDKAVWEAWLAENKTLRYVLDKSIFVIT